MISCANLTNLLSVGHIFIECWSCAPSLSFSSFFFHRNLWRPEGGANPAFTGPIPSEISSLTQLDFLYAPHLIQVFKCWSYASLIVGHARLSLTLSSFFSCSTLSGHALTGTIPPQISALTKLATLYAPKWHIH